VSDAWVQWLSVGFGVSRHPLKRDVRSPRNQLEHAMKRTLATVTAAVLFALATSAHAQSASGLLSRFTSTPITAQSGAKFAQVDLERANYTDGWWVPSESGWGVSILQLGNSMALMFYIFDEDRQPVWYRGVATNASNPGRFEGQILLDTGTSYREPVFGPIPGAPTVVGTVSLTPTTLYDAQLSYTINGTTSTKQLTRISFSPERFDGVFSSVVTARINGCQKNGDLSGAVLANATLNGSDLTLSLDTQNVQGGSCVIGGTFVQKGRLGQVANGTYLCSDNTSGSVNIDGWETSNGSFSALITTSSGGCTESGRIVGSKL